MKNNKDLLIAAVITLIVHIFAVMAVGVPVTPVKYDVVKSRSSVEVTLVKKQKKKVVKKPVPEKVEKKVEKKKPEKNKKIVKKVEKKPEIKEEIKEPEVEEKPPVEEVAEKEIPQPPQPETTKVEEKNLPPKPEPPGTPVEMPAYLNNRPPAYPEIARRNGYEGTVVLRVYVLPDGNPDKLEIEKQSGYSILDNAAINAVKKWKFKPATRGSKDIASWVIIPIKFRLEDA